MDAAWENGDARTFLLNNFRFHSLIYWKCCGNQDLSELAEILYARSGPWLGKAIRELADKLGLGELSTMTSSTPSMRAIRSVSDG